MANDFNLPPGPLSAYLGVRSANQRAGVLDTENSARLMGILMQAQRAKQDALTNPLEVQLLQSQIAAKNEEVNKAKRLQDFNSGLGRFMSPGTPEISLPEELAGPVQPAQPGKFDLQGALQAKMAAGLLDPIAYAKEMQAENKPVSMGRGGLAIPDANSPNGYRVIQPPAAPEKVPTLSPVAKLIAERDALIAKNPNDPNIKLFNTALTHATNPQAQRIIIPPQPAPVQTHTDANGKVWERARGGKWVPAELPGGEQMTSRQPAGAQKQMSQNDALSAVETQIQALQQHIKNNEGMVTGTVGVKGLTGRVYESVRGLIPGSEFESTPALDAQSQKEFIIGNIRSLMDSGNFSNADKARIDAAIGTTGLLTTPGNAVNSLDNALKFIREKKKGMPNTSPPGRPKAEDFFTNEKTP